LKIKPQENIHNIDLYDLQRDYSELINKELLRQELVLKNSWKWRIGSVFVEFIVLIENLLKSPKNIRTHLANYYKSFQKIEINYNEDSKIPQIDTNYAFTAGVILDEFTSECLKFEFNLDPVLPNNYNEDRIAKWKFLLVESAWKGNKNTWTGKIGKYVGNNYKELKKLLKLCKKHNVPTIFWNKEDPVHFDHFIKAAKLFDHVFTTDSNKIKGYESKLSSKNVYHLGFAAQPKIHHPNFNHEERLNRICFAGSYWNNKYIKRKKMTDMLLHAAIPYGLDIYDRNLYKINNYEEFKFPEEFKNYIRGYIPFDQMSTMYRRYKIFLNVNSVTESPTMLSRRVYELLASGTPVISSPSQAISRIFNRTEIFVSDSASEIDIEINRLLNDTEYWLARSNAGINKVKKYHTYKIWVKSLLTYITPTN